MRDWAEAFVQLVAPEGCAACDGPRLDGAFCPACTASVEPSGDSRVLFEYGGPVADAIQRFKYEGRSDLSRPLGRLLSHHAERLPSRIDAVMAVPLHWRRRRARGYDQAALLAKPVARALGVPLWLRRLRRTRATPQQTGLSRIDRLRNVAGAFSCDRLSRGPRVLLIDDVTTTGATLGAAGKAVLEAGATDVMPLVLAARVLR